MESIDQTKLLPVGETIDFNDSDIEINRLLGSGFTSVVYSGLLTLRGSKEKKDVAIKVFKPTNIPEMRNTILEEGTTLKSLNDFEKEKDEYADIVLQLAPIYYGMGNYQGNTFLVMELVDGKELPAILKEKRILSERQTLAIAWQFCRMLELMHTKLGRTYIDMKLENLWLSNKDEMKLRVIDLGMLQEIKPDANYIGNPRLDLLKAAIIFFRLVTGKNLVLDVSNLKQLAEPLIEEAQISWGLKEFFMKALSRNPSYRYPSALEMKKSLYDLNEYWQLDAPTLIKIVYDLVNQYDEIKLESGIQKAREIISRAQAMISVYNQISSAKDKEDTLELVNKVQEAYEATNYLEHGKALLRGGSFKGAENQFSFGESISIKQAEFRRWKHVAMLGGEITSSQFNSDIEKQVEGAIERMMAGDFQAANNRCKLIQGTLPPSKGLAALLTESEIFLGIEQAKMASTSGDYAGAARIFREAQKWINNFPIPAQSLTDELGSLDTAAEENELITRTVVEADKLLEQAKGLFQDKKSNAGIILVENAWNIHPKREKFIPLLIEYMSKALSEKDLELATRFAYISSYVDQQNIELYALRETATRLTAINNLFLMDNMDLALREIRLILAEPQIFDKARVILKELISSNADKYIKAKDSSRLNMLYELIKQLMKGEEDLITHIEENLSELVDQTTPELKKQIDNLFSEAIAKLYAFDLSKAGEAAKRWPLRKLISDYHNRVIALEQNQQDLDDIKDIARPLNYRINDIEKLSLNVSDLIKKYGVEAVTQKKALEDTKPQLDSFRKRTDLLSKQQTVLIHSVENQLSAVTQSQIRTDIQVSGQELLSDIFSYAIQYDPEDLQVKKLLSDVASIYNFTGSTVWDHVIQFAETHKADLISKKDNIGTLINNGELEKATGEIILLEKAQVSSDITSPLKKDIVQLMQIREWMNEHQEELANNQYSQELIDQIRSILDSDQAKRVWTGSAMEKYISQVSKELNNQLNQLIKKPEKQEYFDVLKKWLHLQIILREIPARLM